MKKRIQLHKGQIFDLSLYNLKIKNRKIKREVIEHPGAAAILAFDENDKVILVKQYRFPHGDVLEIPAGTLEKNEEPKECAFRELQEETGYAAKRMAHIITYYPSIGYSTEAVHCYIATGIKKISDLQLDEDEIISVKKMKLNRVLQMIRSGKIQDSKTICAVMTYVLKKKYTKI